MSPINLGYYAMLSNRLKLNDRLHHEHGFQVSCGGDCGVSGFSI